MSNEVVGPLIKAFVERAERIEQDKADLDQELKDLIAEVRGAGYDVAIFKDTVKARKQDPAAAAERSALLSAYLEAAK